MTSSGTVHASFRPYAPVSETFFQTWVDFRLDRFNYDYRGHHYRPVRTNPWREGLHRIEHTLHLPDKSIIAAPFGISKAASPTLLAFWIDNGMPDPDQFGQSVMTVNLMVKIERIAIEYNVEPGHLDHAAVLMRMQA